MFYLFNNLMFSIAVRQNGFAPVPFSEQFWDTYEDANWDAIEDNWD